MGGRSNIPSAAASGEGRLHQPVCDPRAAASGGSGEQGTASVCGQKRAECIERRVMDFRQLHYLLSLERTLNFTQAAKARNVTQPALAKSIQQLEEELGGPLLLRERSLAQSTPLGQAMLPLLDRTYAAAEHVKSHPSGMKRQTSSPLRLGFAADVPTHPFLPLLKEIGTRLPGLHVTVADAGIANLCDSLLHGTLDAALVTGSTALPDRLNRWTLFTDMAALLMPTGHALDAAGALPLAALDGMAVIQRAPDCGMARLLEQAERDHGALPGHRHCAGTAERMADLVRAGLGVGHTTELALLPEGLCKRRVAGLATHDVVLVAVAGRLPAPAAAAFVNLARARNWVLVDAPDGSVANAGSGQARR